jgi:hypothetical protein
MGQRAAVRERKCWLSLRDRLYRTLGYHISCSEGKICS